MPRSLRPRADRERARRSWNLEVPFAAALSYSLVISVPLVTDLDLDDAYRGPKLWLFEGLVLLIAVLAAGSLLRQRWVLAPPLATPAVRAVGPFWLACMASWWISVDRALTVQALISLTLGLALLVFWSVSRVRLDRLLSLLSWTAALIGLIACVQYLRAEGDRGAVNALIGNPGDVATFLVIPALWFQAEIRGLLLGQRLEISRRESRRYRSRILLTPIAAGAASVHLGLLATQSILATFALACGTLVLWRPRRWRWSAIIAFLVICLGLGAVVWWSPLRPRVVTSVEWVSAGETNAFLSGRLDGWRVAGRLFSDHPVLGVGFGTFRREFNSTKEQLISEGEEFYAPLAFGSTFVNAHSEVLELLAESGVVGGLGALWALFVLISRPGIRPLNRDSGVPALDFTRSALIALGVVSLGNFPLRLAVTALPAILVLATALREEPDERLAESPKRRRAEVPRWSWSVGLVLALSVLAGQAFRTRDAIRAESALVQARAEAPTLIDPAAPGRRERAVKNLGALQEAFTQRPFDERLPLSIGSYYLLTGDAVSAERWYRQGLAIEVRPELLLNLSRAVEAQGRLSEAHALMKRVERLDPYRKVAEDSQP